MSIAIYGAGQYGDVLYRVISKTCNIDFFIDEYTDKRQLHSKPIYRLKDAPKAKVYNSVATYEEDVLSIIDNYDLEFISFVETLKEFPLIIKEFENDHYLWLKKSSQCFDDRVEDVRKLFKEAKSLEIFNKVLEFRKNYDIDEYPCPNSTIKEQYFLDEIPLLSSLNKIKFIDCGAFTGDTIEALMNKTDKVEMICAFEIEHQNIKKLQLKAKKYMSSCHILIYPMGVFSQSKILKFTDSGAGSNINSCGNIEVSVTSLDECVYAIQPNFIKMDIEGAEKEAILGAKKIIEDFTPNLAIAIYHKYEDLYELPLLINSINQNYNYYIRVHNHMALEMILYCVKV
jgi:FkbM family methyltransferase